MPNRLAAEASPYLLQHANNPVDWLPWGEEALTKARGENKLIFLSIGYAACHWCHVMERESFEDAEVAAALNRDFVPVKVDREERPDLDEIYMSATMLFTGGHGGWPMSVFLAPDLRPVYAGTYFSKDNAYGRPGFKTLLRLIHEKWRNEGGALLADASRVVEAVKQIHAAGEAGGLPEKERAAAAADAVYRAFDLSLGGIASGANKFPQSLSLDLLLRAFDATGDARYRDAVEITLERMANGGIYDHLGGGLHRYATDPKWLVPHFEKMLYDQALVASIFLDACQVSGDPRRKRLFADRARGICDYVLRDLTAAQGAFYSSEDADSEGLEGKFYIWTRDEIREVLGEREAKTFAAHYDVSEYGNWMHPGDAHVPAGPKNVLQIVRPAEVIAKLDGAAPEQVEVSLAASRAKLLAVRESRPRPGLDDKILTGWNGLMIAALAKAAVVLQAPRYGEAGARAARFLLREVRRDGRLSASYGKGKARLTAYSSDYAFLIEGLIALYEWNDDPAFLDEARALTETLAAFYWDAEKGGFFFTASDHEKLLVRTKTAHDGAVPSANSTMALALQKLAVLLGRDDYKQKAERILRVFSDASLRAVFQQERLLCALDAWHRGFDEIAVVGEPDDPRTQSLLAKIHAGYRPNKVVARCAPQDAAAARVPLLTGKTAVGGAPTAYVCRNYVCRQPVTDPGDLFARQGRSEQAGASIPSEE